MSSTADRYLHRILSLVVASPARTERLRNDIESHFAEASEHGESEHDVIQRLGTPEEVAASFMAEVDLRFAGFWERLVAFVGDIGLCFALLLPFGVVCAMLGPTLEGDPTEWTYLTIGLFALVALSAIGIFALYFPVLEHLYGKTFGKRVLGLRVIREQGGPIGLAAAFVRRLPYFFKLLWLDALFIPFSEKKQRAFDIVAKTVVIREPDSKPGLGGWLLCLAPWLLIALVSIVVAQLTAA